MNVEVVGQFCYQASGKPIAELPANLGYKSPNEVQQTSRSKRSVSVKHRNRMLQNAKSS